MRRGLRIDPSALHYVHIQERLRPRIEELVERYAALERSRNTGFMLAALHYLLHDVEGAQRAIEQGMRTGDGSQSTLSLRDLIAQERVAGGNRALPSYSRRFPTTRARDPSS